MQELLTAKLAETGHQHHRKPGAAEPPRISPKKEQKHCREALRRRSCSPRSSPNPWSSAETGQQHHRRSRTRSTAAKLVTLHRQSVELRRAAPPPLCVIVQPTCFLNFGNILHRLYLYHQQKLRLSNSFPKVIRRSSCGYAIKQLFHFYQLH